MQNRPVTSSDPASSLRRLVLMRHAKAEAWGETDHDRLLTEKGRADAFAAGQWLTQYGFTPDRALVSSAARTRQTWSSVSEGARWTVTPTIEDGLFTASPETALDLIRETPPEVFSLITVAHNPTVAYLAQMLDDGGGDAGAGAAMAGGYPPSALTVFTFEGDWSDLDMASASCTAFHVGGA